MDKFIEQCKTFDPKYLAFVKTDQLIHIATKVRISTEFIKKEGLYVATYNIVKDVYNLKKAMDMLGKYLIWDYDSATKIGIYRESYMTCTSIEGVEFSNLNRELTNLEKTRILKFYQDKHLELEIEFKTGSEIAKFYIYRDKSSRIQCNLIIGERQYIGVECIKKLTGIEPNLAACAELMM